MKPWWKNWAVVGPVLVAVLVLIVGAMGWLLLPKSSSKGRPVALTALARFHYACHGDAQSLPCLQQHYTNIAAAQGPTKAFDALKAAYATDANVKADCHQLAHVIGRTQAEKSSSIAITFGLGDQFCWSGYYHGAMETYLTKIGSKNLVSKLPTICGDIKKTKPYSFYHYNCVHGMGHGVFAVEANDLMKTLTLCDLAGDSWEQQSCEGGAFMQNVMAAEDPNDHTDFLHPDQPMYPCTAVDTKYKQQCYLMQTSYALRQVGQDFVKVFGLCANVDGGAYKDTCYQSLGRDASGNSISAVGPTVANCMVGPDQNAQSNCIVGAVKDFVSYFHSDVQAGQLCAALSGELQVTCDSTKKSYYLTF